MRIRQAFREETESIQMAPLIDIVFLTLIFFMWISVYATLESEVDIQLPTADTAQRGERSQGEIFINLNKDGTIMVNERSSPWKNCRRPWTAWPCISPVAP